MLEGFQTSIQVIHTCRGLLFDRQQVTVFQEEIVQQFRWRLHVFTD
jgi:hypothetical protein